MYTDIKTFEDACAYRGYSTHLPVVSQLPEHLQALTIANYKMAIIAEALNAKENNGETWIPDYNDFNEEKWSSVWDMETYGDSVPGSGFVLYDCRYGLTHSCVGARLDYISEKVCRYAATQFVDIYRCIHKM